MATNRRVFLDIGAYQGETVEAVVGMGFDHIYSFEPMPAQFAELTRRFGSTPNVTLLNFGLLDKTGRRNLYGTNEHFEASIFSDRSDGRIDKAVVTECEFVDAAQWFRTNLTADDHVVAKINCEGSEVDILGSLIASGEIWKLAALTVCFDIQNIPGHECRETEIRDALEAIEFRIPRWHLFGAAVGDTHRERIKDWLGSVK